MFFVNRVSGNNTVTSSSPNSINSDNDFMNSVYGNGFNGTKQNTPDDNPNFIIKTGKTLYSVWQNALKDNPELKTNGLTLEMLAYYNDIDLNIPINETQEIKIPIKDFDNLKEEWNETVKKINNTPVSFKVEEGQDMEYFSTTYKISPEIIKRLNNLTSDEIPVGSEIILSSKSHFIQTGDTIYNISKKYGIEQESLLNANPELEFDESGNPKINIGEVLVIPEKPQNDAEKYDPNRKFNSNNESIYEVNPEDNNLGEIAMKLGLSVENLKKWNNFTYDKNNEPIVIIGQKINIKEPTQKQEAKQDVATTPTNKVPAAKTEPSVSKTTTPTKVTTDTPSKPAETGIYTVKKGDTIGEIASKAGVSVDKLKLWNGLKNNTIQLNQKIYTSPPISRVAANKSFSLIASEYGIKPEQLKKLNPQIKDINKISKGQMIYVPKFKGEMPVDKHIEGLKKLLDNKAPAVSNTASNNVSNNVSPTKPTTTSSSNTKGIKKEEFSACKDSIKNSILNMKTETEKTNINTYKTMLKQFEKFEKTPIKDCEGNWTVGYGHKLRTGEWNKYKNGISKEAAEKLLNDDITETERLLRATLGNNKDGKNYYDTLTKNQQIAIFDLAFNLGSGKLKNTNLLKAIKSGNTAEMIQNYDFNSTANPGIYRRRAFLLMKMCNYKPNEAAMGKIMKLIESGYNKATLKTTYVNTINDTFKFYNNEIFK